MTEAIGWLLDVFAEEDGITLWVLAEDGERLHLRMDFDITLYVAGDFSLLRQAWKYLRKKNVRLERTVRRDLFLGERDVMAVATSDPAHVQNLFGDLQRQFPSLDYYDADIPITLRFIAQTNTHLLGRCRVMLEGEWVQTIEPLSSPWEIDPKPIPLRILTLAPECNPAVRKPKHLQVNYNQREYSLSLESPRPFLISLKADLQRIDPDLILTDYGDTWLFPLLSQWEKETGIELNLNRDRERQVLTRKANSFFAYGQVTYRGAQAHLFGRWHIDRKNAMSFGEYGLEGAMEQARVTGIGVQEMARKSPGAGITAMQMLTALRNNIMVPVQKQQVEGRKTLAELIRADHGGLIYQPIIGLHGNVAQIDFSSMYPAIMVKHNISPETVGLEDAPEGLIPKTLRPLLEKRLILKNILSDLDPRDCRVEILKARASALKWLLVVCFGYLGYKNARFGKIESHEAVTAMSRELMLQAKEVAEDMGFTVLHMYVDCLFVQQEGFHRPFDFTPLMNAIEEKTGIPITLEGVFKWVAFLASKRDARVPVPNQYFGAFQDGTLKYRGIELRRRDTTLWVRKTQLKALEVLAGANTPHEFADHVPDVMKLVEDAKRELRTGRVPLGELLIRQRLSRTIEAYKTPSPAARAARQLQAHGRQFAPGQSLEFVFARNASGVHAWELNEALDSGKLDTKRYYRLLDRAIQTVIDPCKPLLMPERLL
ncbi:MAG TPA: DNA polymerase domain-containing protein [Anaerolineales bacterium]|nr:DNA polymerase domain-containing protein [Anaerolineales bacterium]HRK89179.1 DNA polymerase domain-containing protein [Anaerolineales bacterium]